MVKSSDIFDWGHEETILIEYYRRSIKKALPLLSIRQENPNFFFLI